MTSKPLGVDNSGPFKRITKLEDADTVDQFIRLLEAQIYADEKNEPSESTTEKNLLIELLKQRYTLEELDGLTAYDIDPTRTRELFEDIFKRLPPHVVNEYSWSSQTAARERKGEPREFLQANTVAEFFETFAGQIKQNATKTAQQEHLLKCFKRYLTFEETTDEMKRFCNMDATDVDFLYYAIINSMKGKVKQEFRDLVLAATRERTAQPLAAVQENQKVPEVHAKISENEQIGSLIGTMGDNIDQLQENQQVISSDFQNEKAKISENEQIGSLIGTMGDNIDQLQENQQVISPDFQNEKVLAKISENEQIGSLIGTMGDNIDQLQENQQVISPDFQNEKVLPVCPAEELASSNSLHNRLGIMTENINQELMVKIINLEVQIQNAMQQTKEITTTSDNNLKDFLRAINDRFDHALGPDSENINKLMVKNYNLEVKLQNVSQHMKENTKTLSKLINDRFDALIPDSQNINQLLALNNNFDAKIQNAMKEMKEIITTTSDENLNAVIKVVNDRFDALVTDSQHSSLYGLPLPQLSTEEDHAHWPEGVQYEFKTLPVDCKGVVDGDGINVYVRASDPFVLSRDARNTSIVTKLAAERAKAFEVNNLIEARQLEQKISKYDYKVITMEKEDVLAYLVRIRLRGIDAPELDMEFGKEAQQGLLNMVVGKVLKVLAYYHDRFKRCVADVHCEGIFVQEELLRKGFAWHYTDFDSRANFAEWEKQAKQKKLGLWASVNPQEPWEWRKKNMNKKKK